MGQKAVDAWYAEQAAIQAKERAVDPAPEARISGVPATALSAKLPDTTFKPPTEPVSTPDPQKTPRQRAGLSPAPVGPSVFAQFFEENEGRVKHVYPDPAGNSAIGVGFNLDRKDARQKITALGLDYDKILSGQQQMSDDQITRLRDTVIEEGVATVKTAIPSFDQLSMERQIVLMDMATNMGQDRFFGFSRMIDAVNIGDFEQAAWEIMHNSEGGPSPYSLQVPARAELNADKMAGTSPEQRAHNLRQAQTVGAEDANSLLQAGQAVEPAGLPEFKQQQQAAQHEEIIQRGEAGAQFLLDQRNLAIAHDSLEEIDQWENNWKGIKSTLLGSAAGLMRVVGATSAEFTQFLENELPLGVIEFDVTGDGPLVQWRPSTNEEIHGDNFFQKRAQRYDHAAAVLNYKKMHTWEEFKDSPLTEFIPFAIETTIVSLPEMALAIAAMPVYALSLTGQIGQERANNNGKAEATVEDLLISAPAAVAIAWFERFGAHGFLGINSKAILKGAAPIKEIAKAVAKQSLRGAGREAATEFAQEGLQATAETLGTVQGFNLSDVMNRAAAGLVVGGTAGGTIRAGTSTIQESRAAFKIKKGLVISQELIKRSKIAARSVAAATKFHVAAMRDAGVGDTVKVDAEKIMEFAEESDQDTDVVLAELGVAEQMPDAMEAKGEVDIELPSFVTDVLGKGGLDIIGDHVRLTEGQKTVAETVKAITDQALPIQAALIADTELPTNVKARTQKVVAAFLGGETETEVDADMVADLLGKQPVDVMAALATLMNKIQETDLGVAEQVVEGRIAKLDEEIAQADKDIVVQEDTVAERQAQALPVLVASRKLDRLTDKREKLETEQQNIKAPRRKPVKTPPSESIRQPSTKGQLAVVRAAEDKVAKLEKEKAQLDKQAKKDKSSRLKKLRTAKVKQIAAAKTELKAADKAAIDKPAAKKLTLKARALDRLNLTAVKGQVQAAKQSFREALKVGKTDMQQAQKILKALVNDAIKPTQRQQNAITAAENKLADLKDSKASAKAIGKAKGALAAARKAAQLSTAQKKTMLDSITSMKSLEQLQRQLPAIRARILTNLEREQRRNLRKAIGKVLTRTKPDKTGQRPVGKFKAGEEAADAQAIVDQARDIFGLDVGEAKTALSNDAVALAAAEKLDALVANLTPDINEAFFNGLLQIAARDPAISVQSMEDLLTTLEVIEAEGIVVGAMTLMAARLAVRADRAEFTQLSNTDAFGREADPKLSSSKELNKFGLARIKQARTFVGTAYQSWSDILDILLNKRGMDAGPLVSRLELTDHIQLMKGRHKVWQDEYVEFAMTTLREPSKGKLWDRLHQDQQTQVIGGEGRLWIDQNGSQALLEYSKAEARKLWMEWQDPTLKLSITGNVVEDQTTKGNAYTDEMREAIFALLDKTDFAFANAQLDFYNRIYPEINAVYRRTRGIDLPFNEFYSPISRDLGKAPEATVDGVEILSDGMEQEQTHRRQLPSQTRSRKDNRWPLKQQSDVSVIQRYMHDMAWYIETTERVAHIRAVFGTKAIQDNIRLWHSNMMNKQVEGFIDDFGTGYPARGRLVDAIFTYFHRRFAPAELGFKATIGIKQITSVFAMWDNIPAATITKISGRMLADPVFAKKMVQRLWKLSPALQTRDPVVDLAMAHVSQVREAKFQSNLRRKTGTLISTVAFSAIKLGDRLPIYIGGAAVFQNALDQGKTETEAIRIFERAMNNTQQSTDIDQLGSWQRSGGVGRFLTMFMTARFALLRGEQRMWRRAARGKLSAFEFGKQFAGYHIAMPTLIQWIANGFRWDDTDQLVAILLGQLNALVIIGDITWYALQRMLADDDDQIFEPRSEVPLIETFNEMGRGLMDAVLAEDLDDLMSASAEVADGIGTFKGVNVEKLREIGQATLNALEGEGSQADLLVSIGLGRKTAEEAAATELFSFESLETFGDTLLGD